MTKTVQHDAKWLLTNHDHEDAFEVACARQIRRLLDSNADLQRTLRLARAQLASHLQELADCHASPVTGLVDDPQVLLILESEQDLINQIDEALDRATRDAA
jgi:hypothetical protein